MIKEARPKAIRITPAAIPPYSKIFLLDISFSFRLAALRGR
jgi:hypothetical protein